MSVRARRILLTAAAVVILAILALNIAWPITTDTYDEVIWMWVAGLMAFPVTAALVLSYRPESRVGWALGVVAVSAGLIFFLSWYAVEFPEGPLSRHAEAVERIP